MFCISKFLYGCKKKQQLFPYLTATFL